jgi:secondary thiamine-phosphate synthase enzyme
MVYTESFQIRTRGYTDIIDITNNIESIVKKAKIKNGIVNIFCPGSTGGITTIEYEPGLLKDIPEIFESIAPQNKRYHHDDTWHDGNGFSHVRAALTGASFTVPFVNGKMTLGTWQQIVFIDFDNRSRHREIVVQMMGK